MISPTRRRFRERVRPCASFNESGLLDEEVVVVYFIPASDYLVFRGDLSTEERARRELRPTIEADFVLFLPHRYF